MNMAALHEETQAVARAILRGKPRLRPGERTATIGPWGFDMEVTYEYQEGEPAVLWGDYPHPGSPAGCAVISVTVGGVDITEMLVDSQYEHIEAKLLEDHEE